MNVAVIGAGGMGQNHARSLFAMPDVNLLAIVDPDPRKRELARNYRCQWYETPELLLKCEPELEAVTVCVPTLYHFEVAMMCLEHGLPVLVEKPIAASLSEARQMIALARKMERILMIGHIERFNPVIVQLRTMLQDGFLGEVNQLDFVRRGTKPNQIRDANVLLDIGIHDLDLARLLTGFPNPTIKYVESRAPKLGELEEDTILVLECASIRVTITSSWLDGVPHRELTVFGSRGRAQIDLRLQQLKVVDADTLPRGPYVNFAQLLLVHSAYQEGRVVCFDNMGLEPLRLELEAFFEAIRTNQPPPCPPEEALAALELVLEATEMIRNGRFKPKSSLDPGPVMQVTKEEIR